MDAKKQEKLMRVGQAAAMLGVTGETLRRWEREGKITPSVKSQGTGWRRYAMSDLESAVIPGLTAKKDERKTVAYARVSSSEQAGDLERQADTLVAFCSARGWTHETIRDIGSGMNYKKKGLKNLLNRILAGDVERLVVAHKDRLLRFGAELVFALCEAKDCEVVIINKDETATFEEDLARDVLEIVTVFSARLYGKRSSKNRKIAESVRKALEAA
jgi:putative resolvase